MAVAVALAGAVSGVVAVALAVVMVVVTINFFSSRKVFLDVKIYDRADVFSRCFCWLS